jgi:hypothetical protein
MVLFKREPEGYGRKESFSHATKVEFGIKTGG